LLAAAQDDLSLSACVTGMHLLPRYGLTVSEVEASGIPICGRIPVEMTGTSGDEMARALAHTLLGLVDVLRAQQPDLVMVLGDRGEMLAGALAAIHLNIPIVHIHGGERSGTVDEPIRHAISKLAHYHFTATEPARERLIRMGEDPERVFVTGAPGLDGLTAIPRRSRRDLCREAGLDPDQKVALVLFHPVVQEAAAAGDQTEAVIQAVVNYPLQALWVRPNSDAGGHAIGRVLDENESLPGVRIVTHLAREDFVSWMAAADVMVGNSSSGIIESATLGLPVVNVGSRQQGRERNPNVVDVPPEPAAITAGIHRAMALAGRRWENCYGNGTAGEKIVSLIRRLPLTPTLLDKTNAY
jgi:GDP/UDP-N,N'-diacetylbacillosamine 2-epimerase (hydrolysing)